MNTNVDIKPYGRKTETQKIYNKWNSNFILSQKQDTLKNKDSVLVEKSLY